jgi:hypothetical protein
MSLTNNAIHYKTSALMAAPKGPDKKGLSELIVHVIH